MLEISTAACIFSENTIIGARLVLDMLVCFAEWDLPLVVQKREVWLT